MHHSDFQRRQPFGQADGALVIRALFFLELDLGQPYTLALYFFGGCDHLGGAGDHLLAVLIQANTGQCQPFLFFVLFGHGHPCRNRIADGDGAAEVEILMHIDCARPRELCAKHGRNQRPAPHAVGDDLVEHVALGEVLVKMCGIHIARHHCEELNILLR